MPYEIDWQPMGVIYRFSGVVSDEDLRAATAEVYASPLLLTMKYLIADFSLIEEFAVSSATVRMVADSDSRVSKTNPDVKVAIISTAVFMRGMSNIYAITHQLYEGSWTTKIFECEEDARSWAVPSSERAE